MSTATIPTAGETAANATTGHVPVDVIDNLVVRFAGGDEREAVAELASRAGSTQPPAGALMVAALGDQLLAAVSISTGDVVNEPTSAGEAAAAVVRYRVSRLTRRGAPSTPTS
jgi:hypothetical protein